MLPKGERFTTQEQWLFGLAIVAFVVSLFHNLGYAPLMMEEPRRALIALEMLFNKDFLVPTEMGELYYKKPPLYNWMILLAYELFGQTERAVRIWSPLSLMGMGALLFFVGKDYVGKRCATYSALAFVVSADLYLYFSWLGEIDVFYSLLCLSSFLLFFHLGEKNRWHWAFLLAYTFYALGTLTKGFPSLVFAGFTTIAWLAFKRRLGLLFAWQHFLGIAAYSAIVGLYFYLYYQSQGSLKPYVEAMWGQSSERTAISYGLWPTVRNLFSFPLLVLKDTLPATFLMPFLFLAKPRQWLYRNPYISFSLVALLANIVIYWISPGTRSRYVYMLYPLLTNVLVYAMYLFRHRLPILENGLRILVYLLLAGLLVCSGYLLVMRPLGLPYTSLVVLALLALVSLGLLLYAWNKKRPSPSFLYLLVFMVFARFAVNSVFLPYRADNSVWTEYKRSALRIAELSEDKDLAIYRNTDNMILEVVFYIERERQEVLRVTPTIQKGKYYIVSDTQLPDFAKRQPLAAFEREGHRFYLVEG